MAALLKLIFDALATALVAQLPTFIAAWRKYAARAGADTTLAADQAKIDAFVKSSNPPPPPADGSL